MLKPNDFEIMISYKKGGERQAYWSHVCNQLCRVEGVWTLARFDVSQQGQSRIFNFIKIVDINWIITICNIRNAQ